MEEFVTIPVFDTTYQAQSATGEAPSNELIPITITGFLILCLFYLTLMIIIICGNGLVILAFVYEPRLHIKSNFYITSLAVMDLLTGIIGIPLYVPFRTLVNEVTCNSIIRFFCFSPSMVFGLGSIFHLTALTIDRFISVTYPVRHKLIVTKRMTQAFVLAVWVLPILILTICWVQISVVPVEWACSVSYSYPTIAAAVFVIIAFIFVVFLILVAVMYTIIFMVAYQHSVARRVRSKSSERQEIDKLVSQRNLRAATTCLIVVVIFSVCSFALVIKFLFENFYPYTQRNLLLVQCICDAIFFCSSGLNPIIYGFRNHQYRESFSLVYRSICFFAKKEKNRSQSQDDTKDSEEPNTKSSRLPESFVTRFFGKK